MKVEKKYYLYLLEFIIKIYQFGIFFLKFGEIWPLFYMES
jgi:hypothetical protein